MFPVACEATHRLEVVAELGFCLVSAHAEAMEGEHLRWGVMEDDGGAVVESYVGILRKSRHYLEVTEPQGLDLVDDWSCIMRE